MRPAQHYTMGGVRTDHTGESPTLKGLFAAGEAACWDMHGFNRLGGNSVAETVVAGMIVGEFIADFCDDAENDVSISTGLVHEFLQREQAQARRARRSAAAPRTRRALRGAMQEIMTAKVGIFRTGDDLAAAVDELQALLVRSRNIGLRYSARGAESRARDRLSRAEDAEARAVRRLRRADAHRKPRRAFPRGLSRAATTREWLKRTLAIWKDEADTLPTLAYEPLDVMRMELPPGWRGYGAKDYIDHPDTAARAAEVEAIASSMTDADRFDDAATR